LFQLSEHFLIAYLTGGEAAKSGEPFPAEQGISYPPTPEGGEKLVVILVNRLSWQGSV
jgi:hypothetical protein